MYNVKHFIARSPSEVSKYVRETKLLRVSKCVRYKMHRSFFNTQGVLVGQIIWHNENDIDIWHKVPRQVKFNKENELCT